MRRAVPVILVLAALVSPLAPAARPAPLADSLYIPFIVGGPVPTPTATPEPLFLVTHIVDGDTIDVEIEGSTYRVRYIGIDTPERGDCYFEEAKAKNSELVMGQYVRLVKDVSETDRYGRLLRYVYVGQVFVNYEMVWQGYAMASTYPPDVAHAQEFAQAQHEAQEANRGLWAGCPMPTATPTPSGVCSCAGNLYNCDDFSTQAQAQACHDHCMAEVGYDIHRLDSDGDGEACESLP